MRKIWEGEPTVFLSLGAGVQSSVLLMMSIREEIERPDHVIFSDTGWEPAAVYEHVEWLREQSAEAGIEFHVVRADGERAGNIRQDGIEKKYRTKTGIVRWDGRIPVFVDDHRGGAAGQVTRQCSREYKIVPIRKAQRRLMGYKRGQRIPIGRCTTQLGFSIDEARRIGQSSDVWNENIYPLISDLRMSRADCQIWWDKHYPYRKLQKSACIGCPYHSDAEWRRMKIENPDEFADACEFDKHMRRLPDVRATGYLHRSLQPLRDVDFGEGQESLDFGDEIFCTGGCGT